MAFQNPMVSSSEILNSSLLSSGSTSLSDPSLITLEGLASSSLCSAFLRSLSLFQNHSIAASSLSRMTRCSRMMWVSLFSLWDTIFTVGP